MVRMIIVTRPIKIGRHHRDKVIAVLATIGLAELDAGMAGHKHALALQVKRGRGAGTRDRVCKSQRQGLFARA